MEVTEVIEYIIGFIQVEYIILVPTLIGLGVAIKNTCKIKDEYIPITLMLIGVIFAIFMGALTNEPIIHRVIQGIISAWASGWSYETFTQLKKAKNRREDVDEDTNR